MYVYVFGHRRRSRLAAANGERTRARDARPKRKTRRSFGQAHRLRCGSLCNDARHPRARTRRNTAENTDWAPVSCVRLITSNLSLTLSLFHSFSLSGKPRAYVLQSIRTAAVHTMCPRALVKTRNPRATAPPPAKVVIKRNSKDSPVAPLTARRRRSATDSRGPVPVTLRRD